MTEKKRGLVVDDSTTMRQLVLLILRDFDLTLFEAKDGMEGLTLAARERPDIVLLDVNMPHIDGRETFVRLRKMDGFADVPVVFITSLSEDEASLPRDERTAYVTKPLYADALREVVRRMLDLSPVRPPGV